MHHHAALSAGTARAPARLGMCASDGARPTCLCKPAHGRERQLVGAGDRKRAHAHLAWGWCALVTLVSAGIWAMPQQLALDSGTSSVGEGLRGPVIFCGFFAIFQRSIALPMAPRLLGLATLAVGHIARTPSFSGLGRLRTAVLIIAALLVGELLGLPFELGRRTAFDREAVGEVLILLPRILGS